MFLLSKTSFIISLLVVMCTAEYVSGAEDVTGGTDQAVVENTEAPAVEVEAGPGTGDDTEAATGGVNEGVSEGNPEEAAQDGGAGGVDNGEAAVVEDAPGDVADDAEGSPPPAAVEAASTAPSTVVPSDPPSWTSRLFAAKYMAALGVVYVAVCLFMAVKAGPIVVQ